MTAGPACKSFRGRDPIRVAIAGAHGYGAVHADAYLRSPHCIVTHVADPDATAGARLAHAIEARSNHAPIVVRDMRAVFDDANVDAVSFATPNHWHALGAAWAMEAGKHVYLEKPISHTVREGEALVRIARETRRIFQSGYQHRSQGTFAKAVELIRTKAIGRTRVARCIAYEPEPALGPPGQYSIPSNVDFDLWSGPAEPRPLTRAHLHGDWDAFWDYGVGGVGRASAHWIDLARVALALEGPPRSVMTYGGRFAWNDSGETPNTMIAILSWPESTIVVEALGLGHGRHRGLKSGVIFEGTEGSLAWWPRGGELFDAHGRTQGRLRGSNVDHFDNFVEAIALGRPDISISDVVEGHRSSALLHYANIAYRTGHKASASEVLAELERGPSFDDGRDTFERTLAHLLDHGIEIDRAGIRLGGSLSIDPAKGRFVDRPEADRLLCRSYRRPFNMPSMS